MILKGVSQRILLSKWGCTGFDIGCICRDCMSEIAKAL